LALAAERRADFRAERKGGELLALTAERGERDSGRGHPPLVSEVATLTDLGISRHQSPDWFANITDR
jgi:hypothetical protein